MSAATLLGLSYLLLSYLCPGPPVLGALDPRTHDSVWVTIVVFESRGWFLAYRGPVNRDPGSGFLLLIPLDFSGPIGVGRLHLSGYVVFLS